MLCPVHGVMISGDDAVIEEARSILGELEGAVVKHSYSYNAGGIELIRSWPRPLGMMEGIDESFDAVLFIGYHTSSSKFWPVLRRFSWRILTATVRTYYST